MKTSKNRITLLILSVFFIGILITSCSTEKDTSEETAGSILGRWALDKESFTSNGVSSPEEDYENSSPGCALNDYLEFKDNGVGETGNYDPSCALRLSIGTWTRTGNIITSIHPTNPSKNLTLEIMSLSPTVMKVRIDLTGTTGVQPGVILFFNLTLVKVN